MKGFTEPTLIKAGDKFTLNGFVPPLDCRLIEEENYQRLKRAFDELQRIKDAEDKEIIDHVFNEKPKGWI